MRVRIHTIRGRITLIAVSFTLFITVLVATLGYYLFQSSARTNQIQATEFNLQLVCGLINQHASYLEKMLRWCDTNADIANYISGRYSGTALPGIAFGRLGEEYQNLPSSTYVQRLILASSDHARLLQIGGATSSSWQVTPYNLNQLDGVEEGWAENWQRLGPDPYLISQGERVVPLYLPLHDAAGQDIGFAYMSVSTRLFTDQLQSYHVPEDTVLFLTIGGRHYRVEGHALTPLEESFALNENQGFETLHQQTRISSVQVEGRDLLVVSYPVGDTGIFLSHSLSRQQTGRQLDAYFRLIVASCVGVLALGLFMTLFLARLINRPIAKMRRRLAGIAGGNFEQDPEIEWNNELGDMGRGINKLSRDVVALMDRHMEDEKKKRDLEYRMLQSQINPHFLYNTLNSIKWMADIQNATGISEMTTSLARLLKNVSKGTQLLIPLQEELDLLKDYFVIQRYRYGGSITMELHCAPETVGAPLAHCLIPRLTLQPLVENAIFHGIGPKGNAGEIHIAVTRPDPVHLKIVVEDNGIGMTGEEQERAFSSERETGEQFQKVGLLNVHKRLRYYFGETYGLTLTSSPGVYTRISFLLPWVTQSPDGGEAND